MFNQIAHLLHQGPFSWINTIRVLLNGAVALHVNVMIQDRRLTGMIREKQQIILNQSYDICTGWDRWDKKPSKLLNISEFLK